ncbi:DUF397 domain-containing protein [Streptomyces sp. TRM49041]|uniref:DUF397 domain-containing protein n=1 Tax=Streptomyces sp. TRM49041 TaxID=2603216 RepID=UPI0011EFBD07|nr:DUF397 domain-containing protein [Streptomyces sp. TRM49041]
MKSEAVTPFHKSSFSDQQGDCLEVALTADHSLAIRDSKNLRMPLLHFSPAPWGVFLSSLRAGRRGGAA